MSDRIRPYDENCWYWEYRGRPRLLLGGSVEDNLFQVPEVERELDKLVACGGNYVRCTLSSRDPGNVWPFAETDGVYDLEEPSAEYFRRLERFLELCAERDVVVQVELWDRFDFAREPWLANPYNPKNNRTYTSDAVGLAESYPDHPGQNRNRFFYSVPEEDGNEELLAHQRRNADWVLERTLRYPNVLYCMDNETSGSPRWGAYWARFVRERGGASAVQTTEMWDNHDLHDPTHRATFDHPEIYSFVDVSQNTHQAGEVQWNNLQYARGLLSSDPRPMNNVKVYGSENRIHMGRQDAEESFWRNLFGGIAGVRFHRPPTGIGLSELAQGHIRSARMLSERFRSFFRSEPVQTALSHRSENHAFCFGDPSRELAVLFLRPGQVTVDVGGLPAPRTVQWLIVPEARWTQETDLGSADELVLSAKHEGFSVAYIAPRG